MNRQLHLRNGEQEVIISTQGAYVDSYTYASFPIFFPRQEIDVGNVSKMRGGCHLCFPQFGNGSRQNLPPHGFARDLLWDVVEENQNYVILSLENSLKKRAEYEKWHSLIPTLVYTLTKSSFTMTLNVFNKGSSSMSKLPLAPAFHPYFYLEAKEENISYDYYANLLGMCEQALGDKSLVDTKYVTNVNLLKTETYKLVFDNNQLSQMAIWRDFLGSYICFEPTFNRDAFFREESCYMLEPHTSVSFSFSILPTIHLSTSNV